MTNREILPLCLDTLNGTSVWNRRAEVPGVLQILNGAPGFSRAHASGEGADRAPPGKVPEHCRVPVEIRDTSFALSAGCNQFRTGRHNIQTQSNLKPKPNE